MQLTIVKANQDGVAGVHEGGTQPRDQDFDEVPRNVKLACLATEDVRLKSRIVVRQPDSADD